MVVQVRAGETIFVDVTAINSGNISGSAYIRVSLVGLNALDLPELTSNNLDGFISLNPNETKTLTFSVVIPTTVSVGDYDTVVIARSGANLSGGVLFEITEQNQVEITLPGDNSNFTGLPVKAVIFGLLDPPTPLGEGGVAGQDVIIPTRILNIDDIRDTTQEILAATIRFENGAIVNTEEMCMEWSLLRPDGSILTTPIGIGCLDPSPEGGWTSITYGIRYNGIGGDLAGIGTYRLRVTVVSGNVGTGHYDLYFAVIGEIPPPPPRALEAPWAFMYNNNLYVKTNGFTSSPNPFNAGGMKFVEMWKGFFEIFYDPNRDQIIVNKGRSNNQGDYLWWSMVRADAINWGAVDLTSNPSEAIVSSKPNFVGFFTPYIRGLPSGDYQIKFSLEGFPEKTVLVSVKTNEITQVHVDF